MQQKFSHYQILLSILLLVITTSVVSAPVDFKEFLENNSSQQLKDLQKQQKEAFYPQSKAHIDSLNPPLPLEERGLIKAYIEHPEQFDFLKPGAQDELEALLALHDTLTKIPPLPVPEIYSVQFIDQSIPDKSNFIVANGKPWPFTESEATAGVTFTDNRPRAGKTTVIYQVKNPKEAKPVSSLLSPEQFNNAEISISYPTGSAFEVLEVKPQIVRKGEYRGRSQKFYTITLKELKDVPLGSTILSYENGKELSFNDLSSPPQLVRVNTYDPNLTDESGRALFPPILEPENMNTDNNDDSNEDASPPELEPEDIGFPGELAK